MAVTVDCRRSNVSINVVNLSCCCCSMKAPTYKHSCRLAGDYSDNRTSLGLAKTILDIEHGNNWLTYDGRPEAVSDEQDGLMRLALNPSPQVVAEWSKAVDLSFMAMKLYWRDPREFEPRPQVISLFPTIKYVTLTIIALRRRG